ncbi:TIM barrel protein [uncultured Ruegeria sp.]|uniref:TIM barrel protein n=1 Tax=uncultured Ruegeria sp. TaxID=259304 RepID=UPI0026182648|nr:TIM barrel protein [uncultured Ruegeria sp.]
MPKFVANLSLLFTELPYLDRFQAAAPAGFKAVEILFPYDLAADVLGRVSRPNVGLQFDRFHAQTSHRNALTIWDRFHDRVVHAQTGAAPNRSEPGRGPTDFRRLFDTMDSSGYSGWVSAEYTPSTAQTSESLDWMWQ